MYFRFELNTGKWKTTQMWTGGKPYSILTECGFRFMVYSHIFKHFQQLPLDFHYKSMLGVNPCSVLFSVQIYCPKYLHMH